MHHFHREPEQRGRGVGVGQVSDLPVRPQRGRSRSQVGDLDLLCSKKEFIAPSTIGPLSFGLSQRPANTESLSLRARFFPNIMFRFFHSARRHLGTRFAQFGAGGSIAL
jgi:hypothetical protein